MDTDHKLQAVADELARRSGKHPLVELEWLRFLLEAGLMTEGFCDTDGSFALVVTQRGKDITPEEVEALVAEYVEQHFGASP